MTERHHCPRCSSEQVKMDHPMLTCSACNYVGPAINPNQDGRYFDRARDKR